MRINISRVSRIKFHANWQGGIKATEFQTGLGPCGKFVTALNLDADEHTLRVQQRHDDQTIKDFIYLRADVEGRLEVEYIG